MLPVSASLNGARLPSLVTSYASAYRTFPKKHVHQSNLPLRPTGRQCQSDSRSLLTLPCYYTLLPWLTHVRRTPKMSR